MLKDKNYTFIDNYQFGEIIINGISYHTDVIIFPDKIYDHWWRSKGHILDITDLELVIHYKYKPDILFIGTGMYGLMRVDKNFIQKIKEFGINRIVAGKTKTICEHFNKEKSPKKVAALHLRC